MFEIKKDTKTASNTQDTMTQDRTKEMLEAGVHFGLIKSRRHPSMMPYILGRKDNIEVFDLEKVSVNLEKVIEFIKKIASENKQILFVGGKRESQRIISDGADKIDMPYVSGRFIGGTLTNFDEIKKRVSRLVNLTSQKEKGELAKYTKKERLLIDREIEKLEEDFGGIVNMPKLPAAVFVIDSDREKIAKNEAIKLGIPVIALCNSDCNISDVDFPIPGNDTNVKSISYFVNQIVKAYSEAKK